MRYSTTRYSTTYMMHSSKLTWVFLLLLYLPLLTSCTSSESKQDEEAIKTTLNEMWAAIEQEDIERYASFIHPDFSQFGEHDSVLKRGKEGEVQGVKNWVKYSDNIHTEMEEPIVTVRGNTAWITYYWIDAGMNGEKPFASRGKSTRIFVKEGGKWLCIHGHYTLLPNRKSQRSKAELAIYEQRERSNAALMKGSLEEMSEFWTENIMITTGNGTLLKGKNSIVAFLQSVYQKIPDVVYERTPLEMEVNNEKGLAWESGTWTGFKRGNKSGVLAHGKYSAMWTKEGTDWKIKSQLFVEL